MDGSGADGGVGFDVASSAGLVAVVGAVLGAPGGWESAAGVRAAGLVTRAAGARWRSGRHDRGAVVWAAVSVVVVESQALLAWAAVPGRDAWAWVMERALAVVREEEVEARLGGLCGDSNRVRMAAAMTASGSWPPVVGLWDGASASPAAGAPAVGWRRGEPVVEADLGPLLRGVVDLLVVAGVGAGVAVAGTCRVLELVVAGERGRRHTRARRDAREGVLAALGVSEAAAGAWMSVVSGSRRLGAGSAVVLALREGRALTRAQERWLARVAAGAPQAAAAA